MGKCYECRYFRPSEGKCGYKGYSCYADSVCLANEFDSSYKKCCGNCRYYNVPNKSCTRNGRSMYPYEECSCASHSNA